MLLVWFQLPRQNRYSPFLNSDQILENFGRSSLIDLPGSHFWSWLVRRRRDGSVSRQRFVSDRESIDAGLFPPLGFVAWPSTTLADADETGNSRITRRTSGLSWQSSTGTRVVHSLGVGLRSALLMRSAPRCANPQLAPLGMRINPSATRFGQTKPPEKHLPESVDFFGAMDGVVRASNIIPSKAAQRPDWTNRGQRLKSRSSGGEPGASR